MSRIIQLKPLLEHHYNAFDRTKISPDPLQFLHKFKNEKDIEIIGFISSVFAYGNVTQIINILNKITAFLGRHPHKKIKELNNDEIKSLFKNIFHRFYTGKDIVSLFIILNRVLNEFGSVKNLFMKGYDDSQPNLKIPIKSFRENILLIAKANKIQITPGILFMFADPYNGSACKRMNLFLRWMVRKDELDFGLWASPSGRRDGIPPSKLIIPVDTHIAQICRSLNITKRKNISWLMAEEITENLKKFDPVDPVKYDFAVCHIGIRGLNFNVNPAKRRS